MKHTPGKWKIEGLSIVTDDSNPVCIAVIEDDSGYEAPEEEREGNARLIVAAPDLLAVLMEELALEDERKLIAEQYPPGVVGHEDSWFEFGCREDDLRKAKKAAIAKALRHGDSEKAERRP